MSDSIERLYPVIEKAINRALETAESMPCQVCGDEAAHPYPFAYGKALESEPSRGPNWTTYAVEARAVHICDGCTADYRRVIATRTRNQAIVAGAITVILLVLGIVVPENWRWASLLGAILSALVTVTSAFAARNLQGDPEQMGRLQAIELCKPELTSHGYDQFWARSL